MQFAKAIFFFKMEGWLVSCFQSIRVEVFANHPFKRRTRREIRDECMDRSARVDGRVAGKVAWKLDI